MTAFVKKSSKCHLTVHLFLGFGQNCVSLKSFKKTLIFWSDILKKIAILALDPRNGGGVLHSLQALYRFCQQYFNPTVFFLDFDPKSTANLKKLSTKSTTRSQKIFGMDCVAIGARWAFWEPGHYEWTVSDWKKQLSEFDYFFVTSGTAIAGHPLEFLDKKFVAWLATPLSGDRIGKSPSYNPIRRFLGYLAGPKMLKIESQVLQKASYLLPMSSYAQKSFEKIVGGFACPVEVCGYPLDGTLTTQEDFSVDWQDKSVVSIGRLSDPRKDVVTLLRAWQRVADKMPSAKLELIGEAPGPKVLKKFSDLIDSGKVKVHGIVDQKTKMSILARSRVGVISSLQEGLGIAGLEAASAGMPLVATDCGGPRDYVLEGLTGFVVPVRDEKAMSERILALLSDKRLAVKMGSKAKVLINHFYSQDRIHSKFKAAMTHVWPELQEVFGHEQEEEQAPLEL